MRRSVKSAAFVVPLGFVGLLSVAGALHAQDDEDGYELWLRYPLVSDASLLSEYRGAFTGIVVEGDSPTLRAAADELIRGLGGLLGRAVSEAARTEYGGSVLIGTPEGSSVIEGLPLNAELEEAGDEGFVVRMLDVEGSLTTVIAANRDIGVLYGAFWFLRQLQTHEPLDEIATVQAPNVRLRLLDHWDNLNGTIERGYAGYSLWDWHKLPDYVSPRLADYGRANASIGINGTVLTNVNANALVLTPEYLPKVAAIADALRPYGMRVYLTARFSAPVEIGGLDTADPLEPAVQEWWRGKAAEIYGLVPDFGGFLVKANSEGQPGPQDYGRSHADGANMLADAVAPHGGAVMWRAFVYSADVPVDRVKQAHDEFHPLDGTFRDNVLVQVKNGPLDFQPREPFSPLFGAMPRTPLMVELQVTKEYLGQATHLTYLGPLWEEVLQSDTYAEGPGSTVAKVVDGSLHGYGVTGIAGVANTGTDRNWSGSHFNQADWFAFGRLAWDPDGSAEEIADDWIRATFTNNADFVEPVRRMMLGSREAAVNYMTPLGLAHQMAEGHHWGPGPWVSGLRRPDWTSVYYNRADSIGLGFDRTATGSNAVEQYLPPLRDSLASRATVPDELLLWFHHVRWNEDLSSGRTMWEELVHRYNEGVDTVRAMQRTWDSLEGLIDERRFRDVQAFLRIQGKEAMWWRDACLAYFQTFSGMPIPDGYEPPAHDLDYYMNLRPRAVP